MNYSSQRRERTAGCHAPRRNQPFRFRPQVELLETRIQPSTSQAFVSQVYRDLLAREPEPAGLAAWTGLVDKGVSRVEVVSAIEGNVEFRVDQVEQAYQRFLHRPADKQGSSSFVSFLAGGGTEQQLAATLLASPEYLATHGGTAASFLTALYHDVLGRSVDAV